MRGDFGLAKVDVANTADDDVQERYLPLQWAIDKVGAVCRYSVACCAERLAAETSPVDVHQYGDWLNPSLAADVGVHQ
jgi:hypothetical protein